MRGEGQQQKMISDNNNDKQKQSSNAGVNDKLFFYKDDRPDKKITCSKHT